MGQQTVTANGIDMPILRDTIENIKRQPDLAKSKFHAHNKWISGGHSRTTISDFYSAGRDISHDEMFVLDADEPHVLGGSEKGPNPVQHLLNALAACLTGSMVYHAAMRGIHIEELESHIEGELDLQGFTGLSDEVRNGYENIRISFKVKSDTDDIDKLRECATFSPVFDVVSHGTEVDIEVSPA